MFGFGLSAIDKKLIEKIEATLQAVGTPANNVRPRAKALFDAAKTEAQGIFGADLYATNLGDRLVLSDSEGFRQRLSAGLTENDIRALWNRPPILNIVEEKIRSVFIVTFLESERHRGTSEQQALAKYRKVNPLFGDPEAWNPTLPANTGLFKVDAPLYPEFSPRIERWREKVGAERIAAILTNYRSLNALVRHLVSTNEL